MLIACTDLRVVAAGFWRHPGSLLGAWLRHLFVIDSELCLDRPCVLSKDLLTVGVRESLNAAPTSRSSEFWPARLARFDD